MDLQVNYVGPEMLEPTKPYPAVIDRVHLNRNVNLTVTLPDNTTQTKLNIRIGDPKDPPSWAYYYVGDK